MLSTLTPVLVPPTPVACGIVVDGMDRTIDHRGIVLSNTFPHYVYNKDPTVDRFCLMIECYHPSLTLKERDAIATLFAVKDRFTVLKLELAPWGYDDDDLEAAIQTGAVQDLRYWKEIGYKLKNNKKRSSSSSLKGFGK